MIGRRALALVLLFVAADGCDSNVDHCPGKLTCSNMECCPIGMPFECGSQCFNTEAAPACASGVITCTFPDGGSASGGNAGICVTSAIACSGAGDSACSSHGGTCCGTSPNAFCTDLTLSACIPCTTNSDCNSSAHCSTGAAGTSGGTGSTGGSCSGGEVSAACPDGSHRCCSSNQICCHDSANGDAIGCEFQGFCD